MPIRIRPINIKEVAENLTQEAFGNLLVPPVGQGGVQGWVTTKGGRFRNIDIDSVRRLADFWKKTVTEFMHEEGGELGKDGIEALADLVQARMRAIRRIDPQVTDSPDRILYRKLFGRIPQIERTKRSGNVPAAIKAFNRVIDELRPRVLPLLVTRSHMNSSPADIELTMLLFEMLAEVITLHIYIDSSQDVGVLDNYIVAMEAIVRDERWSPFTPDETEKGDKDRWQLGFLLAARSNLACAQVAHLSGHDDTALRHIVTAEKYSANPYQRRDYLVRLAAAALKATITAPMIAAKCDEEDEEKAWGRLRNAVATLDALKGATGDVIAETISAAHIYRSVAQADRHECGSCIEALNDLLADLKGLRAEHPLARRIVEKHLGFVMALR